MNQTATMQKLQEMGLSGFSRVYREMMETAKNNDFTIDEIIAHLVQAEWDERFNRRFQRLIKSAKFRYQANMEQIDYIAKRNLDKVQMLRLSSCEWINRKQNLLITGSTGLGKSFLSSALGYQACQQGYKVYYRNCSKLFDELKIAKADGSYIKELNRIEKVDVLILDDFGLKPLDNNQRLMLLELLEDRHGKRSTIITSQLPVKSWYEVIGEPTIADAILDRLVHSSHRIEMDGETLRQKYKND
ncbi:MAG: IS21-like element helper ATPase IstB [Bacteroidales bacterium]